MEMFQKLQWDSNFFGYNIAKLSQASLTSSSLDSVLLDLKEKKFRLVYEFVDPSDEASNKAAIEAGGLLVDTKVIYLKNLSTETFSNIPQVISYIGHEMSAQLQSLAIQSGEYSRFRLDPHFTQDEFKKLYTEWIHASLQGKIAKEVLVYRENEKELGVLVIGEKDGRCDIVLLAVDQTSRGKSIGSKLMQQAFHQAKVMGYNEIQVVTQKANKIACSFYEKSGFQKEKETNVYHFWL